jgi:hypothetical protein
MLKLIAGVLLGAGQPAPAPTPESSAIAASTLRN